MNVLAPALSALIALLGSGSAAIAAGADYAVGDRVMVDVNMSSEPSRERWRPGTITEIQMWNGRVSGIFIRTDDGQDIGTSASHLRPGAPAAAPTDDDPASPPAGVTTTPIADARDDRSAKAPIGSQTGANAGKGNCRVGVRVTDRENHTGVVVRADGASCYVRIDGSTKEQYYLAWMLRPAAENVEAERGGALEIGSYSCWTANGVAGTLRLVIRSDSQYADGDGNLGSYSYDEVSGGIRWTSGPWGGFYGTRLAPGKIGISSRPGAFSNTTCERV